ncbi:DUF721 domain-containing protein [Xylophilus rhododendri]|uniref:DUF721 domain-containing protein n=1 Tax=Xylophilus rhododendri TaxID=2697032 RepID=A0A857J544_9BURK|nr:DciA family protein [Xylophilus rhododendri]QHI98152.1 DUF721 domain-containing protein [Xylophilus rhododendri]
MYRRHQAVTLQKAASESPGLHRLVALARESGERLRRCESLIPPMLRARIQAGPVEGSEWCLLAENNAVAAKLRQLLPALAAHLRSHGSDVQSIRVKVVKLR